MVGGDLSHSYRHIVLNFHPHSGDKKSPGVVWSVAGPKIRGTVSENALHNAIGVHAGGYTLYCVLADAYENS